MLRLLALVSTCITIAAVNRPASRAATAPAMPRTAGRDSLCLTAGTAVDVMAQYLADLVRTLTEQCAPEAALDDGCRSAAS